jgi:hypothetical protein
MSVQSITSAQSYPVRSSSPNEVMRMAAAFDQAARHESVVKDLSSAAKSSVDILHNAVASTEPGLKIKA